MPRVLFAVVVGILLCFSAPCSAEERRGRGADEASPGTVAITDETSWYGWQTLLVDVASTVEVAALLKTDQPMGAVIGAGGLVLGGPIVHLLHERPEAAALSFGLRLALPALTTLAGMELAKDHDARRPSCDGCGRDPDYGAAAGALLGLVFGTVSASVIDISALSRETIHRPDHAVALGVCPDRDGVSLSARLTW